MSIGRKIRIQVLLVALVPALMVAGQGMVVLLIGRADDAERALQERARAVAAQAAQVAEFALFSGDRVALEQLVASTSRAPEVRAVRIRDADGRAVASAGPVDLLEGWSVGLVQREAPDAAGVQVIVTVAGEAVTARDPLLEALTAGETRSIALGRIELDMSRRSVDQRQRELLWRLLGGVGIGLLISALIAWRLARALSVPLVRTSEVVSQIQLGNLRARVPVTSVGSLSSLVVGINQMGEALWRAREELEVRVQEAAREAIDQREQAERANRAKSRFLAMVSHDLRQPIQALGLFVAHLREADAEALPSLIGNVDRAVQSIEALLDSLLDLSRLESGSLVARSVDFDLAPLLAGIEAQFETVARAKGLGWRLAHPVHRVHSDPLMLERILRNLVSNAIRYTDRGAVMLACRRRGAHLEIQVRDSGVGIPEESHRTIFAEFVQLRGRPGTGGVGLGLAIVDGLARQIGCSVTVRSAPGRGSTFSVTVPLAAASASVPGLSLGTPTAALAVIIIDDDELVRHALAVLVASWGFDVIAVAHVGELPDTWSDRGPWFVLSDYDLGDYPDGLTQIALLRSGEVAIAGAALMSGAVTPALRVAAARVHLPVLSKPVHAARLRALLQRHGASPAQPLQD